MSQANEAERFMLDLINAERAAVGLDAVILDTRLNDSSEDHSSWMLDTSTFAHQGAGGSSAGDRMSAADFDFSGSSGWGENIAWQSARGEPGILDDVTALHQGLMNSPGHRANILSSDFEALGIGIEVGNFEGFEAVMITQNFAYTDAELAPDTGTTPPVVETPVTPAMVSIPEPETPIDPAPVLDPVSPVAQQPTPQQPDPPLVNVDQSGDMPLCAAFIEWELQWEPAAPQSAFEETGGQFQPFLDAIQSLFADAGWDFWGF